MKTSQFLVTVVQPALARLPSSMNTHGAQVQLLATALQESRIELREQMGGGPARSFFQFEKIGIKEVVMNPRTSKLAREAIAAFTSIPADVTVDEAVDTLHTFFADPKSDILAAVFARLNYYASPMAMPVNNATEQATPRKAEISWEFYKGTWRPGKPKVETWDMCYWRAYALVEDCR